MSTTLLCWCRDDQQVSDAARTFPADYRYNGCRRAALQQTLGRLHNGDTLIITAHGAPEAFGNEDGSFSDFTVKQFANELLAKLPSGWQGKLYFDICDGYTFSANLRPLIHQKFPQLRLFGCEGSTDMDVDLDKHTEVV
jgi:hypothetical protein